MVGRVELNGAVSMASAVLASRNETNWSHQQSQRPTSNNHNFMSKSPFVNSNPNPSSNQKIINNNHHNPSSRNQISHQINNVADHELSPEVSFSHYITFDISAYSKSELFKLKSQLISELDKVRNLSSRIESKKRPSPFVNPNPNKELKRSSPPYVASATVMKSCATVLRKLSNQKAGLWFISPVDVVGMGLHDYHTVIDRPMDLGTIKDKLDKRGYDTPEEFAADVRLTFNNALRYNPKGHEVNTFAGQYLALFERWFSPILAKFNAEKQQHFQQMAPKNLPLSKPVRENVVVVEDEVLESSLSKFPSPEPPKTLNAVKQPEPEPSHTVRQEASPVVVPPTVERRGRPPEGKLPKPKAKDSNKRGMSMDEKRKLGAGLQSLPEEKMSQVIHIIRKRNGDLTQDGDEIELDIEAVDTETLWELDRFVTNYKKMVSKMKRQSLIGGQGNNVGHSDETNQAGMSDMVVEMSSKAKKGAIGGGGGGDVGEEDVDIGDEIPVNNFPPVEIDKDDDSSGSSSSDDSSSSDSDSGSSSGSDSDVDDAQSRDKESSKNFHS